MPRTNLLLILLLISSPSCKEQIPTIQPQKRCVVVFTSREYDKVGGYCRCHQYEWTLEHIGRVGESTDYPLEECDKLIGFQPDTYEVIWSWWESLRLWLNRHK